MEKKIIASVRLNKRDRDIIHAAAQRRKISDGKFMAGAALLVSEFDDEFMEMMNQEALRFKISLSMLPQNLIVWHTASHKALDEVCGPQHRLFACFRFTDAGPLTGDDLFGKLMEEEKERLIEERLSYLSRIPSDERASAEREWLSEIRPAIGKKIKGGE